jgi:signal transduction histidine kinase
MPGPRIDWRFAVGATLALTCLFTIQSMGLDGGPPFGIVHHRQMISWGIWLGLTPAIIAVARRRPLGATGRGAWLGRQVLIGLGFAGVATAASITFRIGFGLADRAPALSAGSIIPSLAGDLLRYALVALAYQAFAYHRAVRERDAIAARLRVDLAEAKLASLEGRLHPHFLFNTLNSIAALVRDDPRAAETMVEQLSELLRASLKAHPLREVPLDEELRLTEQYLAIQSVRFQDRLHTTVTATSAARRGQVPQLILQPLVENAVRHGIAPRESGGSLTVTAAVQNDQLIVTVEDDGVGIGNAPADQAGSGLGLSSVKARLEHLYGAGGFVVAPRRPTGTTITLTMPYRVAVG